MRAPCSFPPFGICWCCFAKDPFLLPIYRDFDYLRPPNSHRLPAAWDWEYLRPCFLPCHKGPLLQLPKGLWPIHPISLWVLTKVTTPNVLTEESLSPHSPRSGQATCRWPSLTTVFPMSFFFRNQSPVISSDVQETFIDEVHTTPHLKNLPALSSHGSLLSIYSCKEIPTKPAIEVFHYVAWKHP